MTRSRFLFGSLLPSRAPRVTVPLVHTSTVRKLIPLALLAAVGLSCAKDGPVTPDGGDGFVPTTGTSLVLSDAATPPFQLVSATVRGATLPASGIVVRLGETSLGVDRLNDSTFVFLPPVVTVGTYPLEVEFGTTKLLASLQIQVAPLTVSNEVYITTAFDELVSLVEGTTSAEASVRTVVLAELEEARGLINAATPAERAAVAAFFAANAPGLGLQIAGGPASQAMLFANATECSCSDEGPPAERFEACNQQLSSFLNGVLTRSLAAAGVIIAARAAYNAPTLPTLIGSVAAVAITAAILTNTHAEAWCKFIDPAFDKLETEVLELSRAASQVDAAQGDSAARDTTARDTTSGLSGPISTTTYVRAAGTFIADTARRLDVYGTYSSPSRALAERNSFVAGAIAQMTEFEVLWERIKLLVPFLADFGTIPETSAASTTIIVPADYLILTGGTPQTLSKSYEVKNDSIFMVTLDLPTIGNDHAVTFDVEYVGPGMLVDAKANYTATLKPVVYPVKSIMLAPAASMIDVLTDGNVSITATLRDSLERILTDRVVTWTSSQPSVATVGGSGLIANVHGVREGLSTIRATAETQSADFIIKVGPMPVDTIDIIPDTVTVGLGGTFQLQAETRDSLGNVLQGRVVEWETMNSLIATVSSTGLLSGIIQGEVTIRATSEGKTNTAFVRVVPGAVDLSQGSSAQHVCAIANGGSLFCWGSNSGGQLGDGTGTSRNVPTFAAVAPEGIVQVTAGLEHSCGLNEAGTAFCWGSNELGQLGDGNMGEPASVAVTGGHTFTKIAASKYGTCAIASTGTTYCWGQRVIGTAMTSEQPTPLAVSGPAFVDLVGTGYGTGMCGRTSAGGMYCWGGVGFGPTIESQFPVTPVQFGGGRSFTSIAAGWHHQCGSTGGETWCWGSPVAGLVGDSTAGGLEDSGVPFRVMGAPGFTSIVAGYDYTCGLTAGGAAWCWGGQNGSPALLAGMGGDNITPTKKAMPVAQGLSFTKLVTMQNTVCGLDNGGIVYCWGENTAGQAGQGMFTPAGFIVLPAPVEDPVVNP